MHPKTQTQRDYIERLGRGESVFGIGPAGVGKTYLPARIAARKLAENAISKIVISRITVAPHQRHALGFLPGKQDEKLAPWMIPVLDGLKAEVSGTTLDKWKVEKKLEFAPFETMRGRTFSDCCLILDEAQNATLADLKLLLTRVGENCQVVITGDIEQIDIRDSGLTRVMKLAQDYDVPMAVVAFEAGDVVRSEFTKAWVKAFSSLDDIGSSNVTILDDSPALPHNAATVTKRP